MGIFRTREAAKALEKSAEAFALPAEPVAAAIAHMLDQPYGLNAGEIVVWSTVQS